MLEFYEIFNVLLLQLLRSWVGNVWRLPFFQWHKCLSCLDISEWRVLVKLAVLFCLFMSFFAFHGAPHLFLVASDPVYYTPMQMHYGQCTQKETTGKVFHSIVWILSITHTNIKPSRLFPWFHCGVSPPLAAGAAHAAAKTSFFF